MKIILLVAAERGIKCLEKFIDLKKDEQITVFSFEESPWEPPFSARIENICHEAGIKFHLTKKICDESFDCVWEDAPDLMFAIGWRYLIPEARFSRAKIGSFVFHDSLLPKYRGFSPSVWAVRNGEAATGATLFKMSLDMDEGDIIDQRKVPILGNHYIDKVIDNVTEAYISMIDDNYQQLKTGSFLATPQIDSDATYTCNLQPDDFQIDWNKSAKDVFNLIRSYVYPYSHSFFFLNGQKIRVKSALVIHDRSYIGFIPGRVVGIIPEVGVDIVTAGSVIRIKDVILDDGTVTSADEVVNKLSYTLV
jgi:methionyl-tRNA formyltransferase